MDNVVLIIRRCKRGNEAKLSLNSKELTSIPSEVFELSNLQYLDLSDNKISILDYKISSLLNLVNLDLSKNSLITIPNSILSLKNLNSLILNDNPLNSNFEPLLKKENQTGVKLQETLKKIFNSFQNEEKEFSNNENSKLNWFNEDNNSKNQNSLSQNNLVNQLINTEKLLKNEEKKVMELTSQIQKLKLNKNSNSQESSGYLNVEDQIIRSVEIDISELKIGETISQGGFSIVHKGYFRGTQIAIKKIFDPVIRPELLAELTNEINMLGNLKHPNIVLLMGVVSKPPNLCIVTEYLPNGSLFDFLHKSKKIIKPIQSLNIIKQIANVCLFLHKSKVCHRDLKSLNILFDEFYRVKLCDFGLARNFSDLNRGTMQFSGTPSYLAPEIFQKKAYDEKIDVFSFGTLLWETFARSVPFEGIDPMDILPKLLKEESLGGIIPKSISKIVNDCRNINPDNRPDFEKIVQLLEYIEL